MPTAAKKKKWIPRNKKYKTAKERKKATLERGSRWQKENTRCINVRYHLKNDAEILEKLDSVPNKGNYIRQLILADIHKSEE